ncbi:hypothetical protein I8748_18350 [Nostoc sp. CENA67]|uniref:Uncharacterized protein n=1 Tax=Amazonocrinis nigriterrae CENA67 TaxID=2794033 RepID=A0A8J7HV11_9NOST|nr:hypothetical protein [Amazonocrinis nigriterrae]MBH8564123.1 hypothetical protein [Amazonocrinis nigriterrae CENA67]
MNTVKINNRITKIQNKLFEQAHTQPLKLKPLAIALSKHGIKGEKLYFHPGMIPLPIPIFQYLSSLNPRQMPILSAAVFANFYKVVANSESQSIISNMNIAKKVFSS